MILRCGKRIGIDNQMIDFNKASKEWRKNKVYRGIGMFSYK
jgi:hypothetical protein